MTCARVLEALFDEDSVLELRDGFGAGMVTALARVDGRPLGVLANDPRTWAGRSTPTARTRRRDSCSCATRSSCPCCSSATRPGFMVGPAAERTATVRHFARMFLTGANMSVPTGTIVLRKGYGLGAQAMAGGGFKAPLFTVALADLGVRRDGPRGRGSPGHAPRAGGNRGRRRSASACSRQMVAGAYERGQGVNMAAYGEIDDVIDPADSRRWIATLFDEHTGAWWRRAGKKRPNIDAW